MSGTEATIDAARTIALSIGDLAQLEVCAGDEASRRAVETLRERWVEAKTVLERAGVGSAKALQELRERLDVRIRKAEGLEQEAAQHEKDAQRSHEDAACLEMLEAQAQKLEAGLAGQELKCSRRSP